MSRAAEMIEALRNGAQVVDEGQFTLDLASSRRRFAKFRYGDRSEFLTPVVEGLFALGADSVDVEGSLDDILVHAPGLELRDAGAALRGLFEAAHRRASDQRGYGLARLGIGIDMAAHPQGYGRIVVAIADGAGRVDALTMVAGAAGTDDEVEVLAIQQPEAKPGMRVFFEKGRVELAPGRSPIEGLRTRVAKTDRAIRIHGAPQPRFEAFPDHVALHGPGWHGVVHGRDHALPSRIVFRSHGIVAGVFDQKLPRGFEAVVDLHWALRDLSKMQLRWHTPVRGAVSKIRKLALKRRFELPRPEVAPPPEVREPDPAMAAVARELAESASKWATRLALGVFVFFVVALIVGMAIEEANNSW